ncbi:hypothetical protein VK70_16730 [Paenibacillus durus ATCC 35681]|uniref:Uncharacterized protein n=1 Tax=Paenibacillus durus ATCC 35681 TaxID=1333534 RepID=A0A0F7CJB1_PAEDU|nr:hypothetical protein VK70_16730 [Paenibacillus durus ATCC 35681]
MLEVPHRPLMNTQLMEKPHGIMFHIILPHEWNFPMGQSKPPVEEFITIATGFQKLLHLGFNLIFSTILRQELTGVKVNITK